MRSYVRLRTRVAALRIRLPEELEQSAKRAYQEVENADPNQLDGEHGSGPRKRVRKEKQRILVAWTPRSGYTPPVNKERFSSGISSSAWCSRMRPATLRVPETEVEGARDQLRTQWKAWINQDAFKAGSQAASRAPAGDPTIPEFDE